MAYRTVLLHVNDIRRAPRLIAYAAEFAEAQGAHLIGLFVVPLPIVLNEWPDIAIVEMIEAQRKAYRDEGHAIEAIFRDKTKRMSRPAEWSMIESQFSTASNTLIDHARSADVVIAPQPDEQWHLTSVLDCCETAMIEGGRPVLVVPNAGDVSPAPKKVTLAWNARREATRAAFDAMPVLAAAKSVDVVWINPRVGSAAAGDVPGAELASALARHGVSAETVAISASELTAAGAILQSARERGSDLIVMGAYGHSRFREFVLGGATREILRTMTLPVMFSH